MNKVVKINEKLIDVDSLVVDGINEYDYPKFVDAYFSKGSDKKGNDLSFEELEMLETKHPELLNELANITFWI